VLERFDAAHAGNLRERGGCRLRQAGRRA